MSNQTMMISNEDAKILLEYKNERSRIQKLPPTRQKRKKCSFYNTRNGCRKGDDCDYSHIEESKPVKYIKEKDARRSGNSSTNNDHKMGPRALNPEKEKTPERLPERICLITKRESSSSSSSSSSNSIIQNMLKQEKTPERLSERVCQITKRESPSLASSSSSSSSNSILQNLGSNNPDNADFSPLLINERNKEGQDRQDELKEFKNVDKQITLKFQKYAEKEMIKANNLKHFIQDEVSKTITRILPDAIDKYLESKREFAKIEKERKAKLTRAENKDAKARLQKENHEEEQKQEKEKILKARQDALDAIAKEQTEKKNAINEHVNGCRARYFKVGNTNARGSVRIRSLSLSELLGHYHFNCRLYVI
jgi:hypothetical protein